MLIIDYKEEELENPPKDACVVHGWSPNNLHKYGMLVLRSFKYYLDRL